MLEEVYEHCRAKACVTEGFPFGEDVLVFKVCEKIFALLMLNDTPLRINLKCEPLQALEWRESYDSVVEGYHMNKKHWNTVILSPELPGHFIFEMIDHSYDQVVKGLSKAQKTLLQSS